MKIKKPKRIMSLFLAALMCVTSLVGIGYDRLCRRGNGRCVPYLVSPVTGTRITTPNGDTAAIPL